MTMKKKTCLKDSRGFTLIELIVVIAIISILSVGTLLGASVLGHGNAKSATGRIKSLLDNVRIENMTKKEPYYLLISQVNNNYNLTIQTVKDGHRVDKASEKLDIRKGKISFLITDGSSYIVSSEPIEGNVNELELTFNKETGELVEYVSGKWVKAITVESGNRLYNIHLVRATGKAYID